MGDQQRNDYLHNLVRHMERTWKALPLHESLAGAEPIQLRVLTRKYEGARELQPQRRIFESPLAAVRAAPHAPPTWVRVR
jgi:hypothetical protein